MSEEQYKSKERPLLYLMVFIVFIRAWIEPMSFRNPEKSSDQIDSLYNKTEKMYVKIDSIYKLTINKK